MRKPNRKTVRDAIRASVPKGKLKRAKIVLADNAQLKGAQIGGFTEYDRANGGNVIKIGAPAADDAKGITIRGHETRHATRHTVKRRKPMTENEAIASQIVDDVNIECTPLPKLESLIGYKRAHLAVAMDGVRTLKKNKRAVDNKTAPDSIALRNGQLLNAVRTTAMLHSYGQGGKEAFVRERGYLAVKKAVGDKTFGAVATVIKLAKNSRQRARAISVLVALMETPESPETEREETPEVPEGDIMAPVNSGDAIDGHMAIRDLRPKTVPCDKEKSITRKHAPNGVIINPTRFLNAVICGDANGLFQRRVRAKAGGCVVIDASGSMGASKENLSALCALVPTATVAYYSGGNANGHGTLTRYAVEGKRYNGELPVDTLMGGNAVDLPAVKWLMKHPKPWVLVSDLEFCGGVIGSEIVAHALVERAVARGELTVYRSLDAAYEAFGGKGNLGDAETAKYRKERANAIAERAERRREREVNRAVADI
jgi:hypothetical protein